MVITRGTSLAITWVVAAALACGSSTGPGLTLAVAPDPVLLFVGDSVQLSVNALDPDGRLVTGIAVSFTAADTTLITVSNLGVVHTRGPTGTTSIRVSGGGTSKDVSVRVTNVPAGILIAPADTSIRPTATVQYRAAVIASGGDTIPGLPITWESTDTSVATVTAAGLAIAKGPEGTAFIVGRYGVFGAAGRLRVFIPGVPVAISVTPNDTAIAAGMNVQLMATVQDGFGDPVPNATLTWQSSNDAIATVSTTGLVHAEGPNGNVFIHARTGVLDAAAVVRVLTPGVPAAISVTPSDTAIAQGATVQLTATVRDGFGDPVPSATVTWESDNDVIATVSTSGLVHSEGPSGSVSIHARSGALDAVAAITVLDSLLIARVKLAGRAYAAAVSVTGVAYVGQSDLARIVRANLPARTFDTFVTVGNTPTEMAFNSTGTRLYVTNQYSNTVSVVNVATNAVIESIPIGDRPFEVIVERGDSILWVAKIDSLYGVRLASRQIIARFQIGDVGNGVAIAHDTLLYVSTHNTGTVVEINLRTRSRARTFTVGGIPQKLVVSPDGAELYIANEAGYLQFWDLATGLQIGANLTLPSAAYGLARRPTNGLLYATSAYYGGGYIYVIDPVSRTLVYSTIVGGATRYVAFTADGSIGIVANEGGWVDFLK